MISRWESSDISKLTQSSFSLFQAQNEYHIVKISYVLKSKRIFFLCGFLVRFEQIKFTLSHYADDPSFFVSQVESWYHFIMIGFYVYDRWKWSFQHLDSSKSYTHDRWSTQLRFIITCKIAQTIAQRWMTKFSLMPLWHVLYSCYNYSCDLGSSSIRGELK